MFGCGADYCSFKKFSGGLKFEDLLGELKAKILSTPCPKCGGPSDRPINPGERIRCKFCGTFYTIETSLNMTSKEAIKNIVSKAIEEVIGKFGVSLNLSLEGLSGQLSNYAETVLEETRKLYWSLNRLPTIDELNRKMEGETQKILGTIAAISQKLFQGQSTLALKIDSVDGKIDSLKVSVKEIKRLLECIEAAYGKSSLFKAAEEAVLTYIDEENNMNKLIFRDIIVGRNEKTQKIEVRFPDGNIKCLGITDPGVSRKHLKIEVNEGKIRVTDLGSRNGTFINGSKIMPNIPYELDVEAKVKIGLNTEFTVKPA
ncbi:MAG: FHA domain-containing protein [Nitrososphaeria archaeon]